MTTLASPADTDGPAETATPAERLRAGMAAVRLSTHSMGVHRSLSSDQRQRAAESFGANGQFLTAGKKLLDTRHPAYRRVTSIRNQLVTLWRAMTLPYTEAGVRLIRRDQIEQFDELARRVKEQLDEAVVELDAQYAELRTAARRRLGELYDLRDYPLSLRGMFDAEWDFPSIEPPDYLRVLSPKVYEAERERIAQRFDEAVRLAEQAFTEEFAKLLGHITERLSGTNEDGRPKVFRDSAVTNLHAFFERFRSLNVGSDEQLDELVETAQQALQGVKPADVRGSVTLRARIGERLASVQAGLDGLMVDRPRRRIVRPAGTEKA